MFALLMRVRFLSARNTTLDTLRRHPLLAFGLTVSGIGLFAGMVIGFWVFFAFANHLKVLEETLYQVFYFLFLFLLAGSVPFIASTLLHSSDYSLLFASPLPPRAVVAAKLLDATITNSLQFTVLGIPAIVAAGAAIGLSFPAWLLMPVFIALFLLLPALLTSLGLLILLTVLGMKRLRAAITSLNALMAVGVCITIVLEASHSPFRPGAWGAGLVQAQTALQARSEAAHLSPSAWFAEAMLGLGRTSALATETALLSSVKIALVVGGLAAVCLMLGSRLLSAANVAEENNHTGDLGSRPGTDPARFWRFFFPAPIAALIHKDFKYIYRDSVLLSQLILPTILFIVPFLLAFQDSGTELRGIMFPFASAMTAIILFMQTSILSLSSLGLESQSFWVILTSPNTGRLLLLAKFLLSSLVSVAISLALTLFSGLVFSAPWSVILIQSGLIFFCGLALCGLGAGISAAFPRFVYENPAHRVSAWALILGFFATIGYLFLTALLFSLSYLFALRAETPGQERLIWGLAVVVYLAITFYAVFLPLMLGARRIERYQWEH